MAAEVDELFFGYEDSNEVDVMDDAATDMGAGITKAELETCCRVLNTLARDQTVFASPQFKELRKCLQPLMDIEQKKRYSGGNKEQIANRKQELQTINRINQQAKSHDKRFINNTLLRAGRIARLEALKSASNGEDTLNLLVPDGVPMLSEVSTRKQLTCGQEDSPALDIENSSAGSASVTEGVQASPDQEGEDIRLSFHRACYICKRRFTKLHFFYDQLCPPCASLNYTKRLQAANLTGKVAVVTGARVKIGFRVCLKLLRCGATVVATTRFPLDALKRLREEADFAEFQHRLHVVGLDLRDVTAVEAFTQMIAREFHTLDILVNNACQTVRRPTAYYAHQVQKEAALAAAIRVSETSPLALQTKLERLLAAFPTALPSAAQLAGVGDGAVLREGGEGGGAEIERGGGRKGEEEGAGGRTKRANPLAAEEEGAREEGERASGGGGERRRRGSGEGGCGGAGIVAKSGGDGGGEGGAISRSAMLSQVELMEEDSEVAAGGAVLPAGAYDVNGSQLDLRTTNSWLLRLHQVSTPELMEVMCINAVAPFTLCAKLEPLLRRSWPEGRGRPHGDSADKGGGGGGVSGGGAGSAPSAGGGDGGTEGLSNVEVVRAGAGKAEVEAEPEGGWAFVVNVSAMEGKFYRHKTPAHPHTNMAKAALNMMTRTSAEDLKTKGVLMNAVDTGWINDENPPQKAMEYAQRANFQTPIDEEDAAARILDPVMVGVRGEATPSGLFLKDYFPSEW